MPNPVLNDKAIAEAQGRLGGAEGAEPGWHHLGTAERSEHRRRADHRRPGVARGAVG